MNIYVPKDLREKMKKYPRTEHFVRAINWSQVACDAFVVAMKKHDEHVRSIRNSRRARRMTLAE